MHASRNAEYQKFVPAFVRLLREAMQLRGRGLEDGDYYDEAKRIKNEMLGKILKADCGFGLDQSKKLRCTFAQMLRCRGQSRSLSGVDRVQESLKYI